jgi:hypothetical protein
MPHELEYPADNKQAKRDPPEPAGEKAQRYHQQRKHDHRDAESVRDTVDRVLVPVSIFLDPFVPGLSAHHMDFLLVYIWDDFTLKK